MHPGARWESPATAALHTICGLIDGIKTNADALCKYCVKRRASHFWSTNWSTWLSVCVGPWKSHLSLELHTIKTACIYRAWKLEPEPSTHESTQSVDISPWAVFAATFPATEMAGKGYPLATPGVFGHAALRSILDNAPLAHPYTTRVIKVDTKERRQGLAQLSVLALPIEMPLHLSSPTSALSKLWAKHLNGGKKKEVQLQQRNENISSHTHTQNDALTSHETIWRRLYEIMSGSAWHTHTHTHSCIHVCRSSTSVSSLPLAGALPYLQMAPIIHCFNLNSTNCFFRFPNLSKSKYAKVSFIGLGWVRL